LIRTSSHEKQSQAIARIPPSTSSVPPLEGWALGTLIDVGAVTECEHHGHRKDRSDPHAWERAREEAWRHPFPGATPEACIAVLGEVMGSIGETCPDCG
jgi:hypothetical protein